MKQCSKETRAEKKRKERVSTKRKQGNDSLYIELNQGWFPEFSVAQVPSAQINVNMYYITHIVC